MAKRIRREYSIYLAPQILGFYENNNPRILDERTDRLLDPYDTDSKIIVYERQVKEWFLNRATRYLRGNNNGFVVLMICLSYLEGVEQYRRGQNSNGRSRQFFIYSVNRLYPNEFTDAQLSDLYSQARCGLFHTGMVDGKIIINSEFDRPIEFPDDQTIKINQRLLLIDIKRNFNNYLGVLREQNEGESRRKFDQMFTNL